MTNTASAHEASDRRVPKSAAPVPLDEQGDELVSRLKSMSTNHPLLFATRMQAAARIQADAAEKARLREALEPFGCDDFEHPVSDENGWTEFGLSWCRERIVDWFGPTAFFRARAALNPTTPEDRHV